MKNFLLMTALSALTVMFVTGCGTPTGGAPKPKGELAGSFWKPVDSPRNTYIEFTDDGRMVGNTGCNRFFGPVAYARGKRIRLGPLALTRNEGPERKYEERFISGIDDTRGYVLDGDTLTLYNEERQPLMRMIRLKPQIGKP